MLREVEPNFWVPEISDLILEQEGVLDDKFCDTLINKFDNNANQHDLDTIQIVNRNFYYIHDNYYWHTDTNYFLNKISSVISEYLLNLGSIAPFNSDDDLCIDTIKLCKYTINNGFFDWHQDQTVVRYYGCESEFALRELQIICYLNDVEIGGETEYPVFDKKIKPKKGKLLICPVGFPFFHKAYPPKSNPKYNIVFQLARKIHYEIVSKDK